VKWLKKLNLADSDTMMLTLAVWLCTLSLIGLFVYPFFGTEIALAAAVVLFFLALLICWGICEWEVFKKP
jgi:hypothetical protein